MSGQPNQRPRRNNSPSTKQGPIKATLQFSLRQSTSTSPTRNGRSKNSPSSSPTPRINDPYRSKARRSPDNRTSPERRSPNSPSGIGHKVERPKPVRGSPIRRTGSLDTITVPYLTGQWPKEQHNFNPTTGNFVVDKATQTEEWDDDKRKKDKHKRSASLGNGDQLKLYKQRLQRGNKPNSNQRQSPIHGNHTALATIVHSTSKPMVIPISHIPNKTRNRGSVEGLNQEIERLVLLTAGKDAEDVDRVREVTPDGHRAPVCEMINMRGSSTRSVDTQTPSENTSGFNNDDSSSSGGSRSQSISPSYPIIPGEMDKSRPPSDSDQIIDKTDMKSKDYEVDQAETQPSKYAASPRPNKSYEFKRLPPDGAEKVKVQDENRREPSLKESRLQSVLVLTQSDGSAFEKFNLVVPVMKNPVSQASSKTPILGSQ